MYAVNKAFFNHKAHKESTNDTKANLIFKPLGPLCNTFVNFVVNGFGLFQKLNTLLSF